MSDESYDVAIIGAGLSGLGLARTYLEVHPECRLVILERNSCVGGVWSKNRVFDDFWVQGPIGQDYFSDVKIKIPSDVKMSYETFPAKYISKYLEEYIDSHVYNGVSLRQRVRFETNVRSVTKAGDEWNIETGGIGARIIKSSKVAVASGLTSLPNIPEIPTSPDFKAPVVHHLNFGTESEAILAPGSPYECVTVLGGGKSAADMAYAAAKAGKTVNWVIRTTGDGPAIFICPVSERYANAAHGGMTRAGCTFNPSGHKPPTWWAKMLFEFQSDRTLLEEKIYEGDRRAKEHANYRARKDARPGFQDLEPEVSLFWMNGPIGAIQHDDFWDIVARNVNVHRGEISETTADSIILNDKTQIKTDVVLCGTGWRTAYPFISEETARTLGLPHDPSTDLDDDESQTWKRLSELADAEIVEQFPLLASPPPSKSVGGAEKLTPARLYRAMAPLTDSSILFFGRCRIYTGWMLSEAQAIWATAYWDGNIKLPEREKAMSDVAYMNVFSKRRYLAKGADGLNFHKDLIWYMDTVLQEVGLSSHRKKWWDDWHEPFVVDDLRDLKDEYLAKYGSGAHK